MKKLRAGLIVEGNSASSVLLRLPSITAELGPVKSGSLQVARRVSNFLRAGYAVTDYDELSAAKIILIKVPDSAVRRVVQEICQSGLKLGDLSFVLCETWMQTEALRSLKESGAQIASIVSTSDTKSRRFVLDGDTAAVRQMRRIVDHGGVKTIELRAGSKHLFFAATVLMTAMPVPLLVAAQKALRDSGVSGNELSNLLEELANGTLATFLRGSKSPSPALIADCTKESADAYFARLRDTHPELASSLKELILWARSAHNGHELTRGHWA